MGIRRVVNTDFWKDDIVAEQYSAEDRYFMLYLLTNPNTKQCGIYHLPIRTMSFELGYTQDATKSIVDRFEKKYKNIIYSKETNEIAILNFLKHSIIKGGKPVEDCIRKELGQVKNKCLIAEVYKHLLKFMDEQIEYKLKANGTSMYVGIKNVFNEFIKEDDIKNDNDNDNDNERIVVRIVNESLNLDIPYKEICEYLNNRAGTNYKHSTKKTKDLIKARFNEGFNLDNFKEVIDKKCVEWMNTDMQKYLRPETLFGTKFEGYLNQQAKKLTTKDLQGKIDISDF